MPKFTQAELEVRRFERIRASYKERITELSARSVPFIGKERCIKKYILSPVAFDKKPWRYHGRLDWTKNMSGRIKVTKLGRGLSRLEVAIARAYNAWHDLPFPHTHASGQELRDSIKNWRFVLRVLEIEKGVDAGAPPVYREVTSPIETPYSRAQQVMRDARIRRMIPTSL